ncbi:MAG: hypothetical protein JSS49_09725 [Planctomycetes bacterium]|nr:hypothetical protein [Planctomycetota bacterium]
MLLVLLAVAQASAADTEIEALPKSPLVIGWRGTYLVGAWTEVAIHTDSLDLGEFIVRITAPDPDGHRVQFSTPAKAVPGQALRGHFKVGQLGSRIDVDLISAETGKTVWSQARHPVLPLDPSIRLVVTVGHPRGFENPAGPDQGADFRSTDIAVAELPTVAKSYDSVCLLVIAGQSHLSAEQSLALRDWVSGGGRLLITLPTDITQAREVIRPLSDWLPVKLGDTPVTVSEFGKLEFYSGRNVRIPFSGRMPIPSLKLTHGEVLAGSRDEALLARVPLGIGSVTLLALDMTRPPLSKWTELPSLARRLAEASPEGAIPGSPTRTLQLSSTGISDLATQLHAVQEDFSEVRRASPWLVMGLLVIFLLIIGPLDYVLVHRLLQRPQATWLTLPVWSVFGVVVSLYVADAWNGDSFRINQLNIVNYDVDSTTCHQRLWTNVYSPLTERHSISVESKLNLTAAAGTSQQSAWSGIPEKSFGGMLREARAQIGSASYQLASNTTASDRAVEGLPLLQWSSKPLVTEIHSGGGDLVECDLQSNGVGQLSGTLKHRLPGPIEDWFLAFGNRVYRHKKNRDDGQMIPLAAGHLLRVDQPNVFPRELRAYLTGKVATGTQREGSQASNVASQFVAYDALSRDPADILRILTFHHEVGGTRYTGLTNRMLEAEDLSHLLKLGRAVLFGRLNASVATVKLDGAELTPDRESTFVRLVLPVTKVGSEIKRDLQRLDK